jgi:DNA-directed RNA polymerase specialized sigma24 family protein
MKTPTEDFDFTADIDLRLSIEKIAKHLKPLEREILWHLMDGASADDIASDCGVSLKRAQNIISNIRKQIREIL